MRRMMFPPILVVAALLSVAFAPPAAGQDADNPTISTRQFTGGSAKLTVTGAFDVAEDVAINTKASYGDPAKTWLQFGASGSAEPNVLVTYGEDGFGIIVGKGKRIATAEPEHCKGKVEVTASSITGQYKCVGVVSYDGATMKMAKIDIEIRFTAKS